MNETIDSLLEDLRKKLEKYIGYSVNTYRGGFTVEVDCYWTPTIKQELITLFEEWLNSARGKGLKVSDDRRSEDDPIGGFATVRSSPGEISKATFETVLINFSE